MELSLVLYVQLSLSKYHIILKYHVHLFLLHKGMDTKAYIEALKDQTAEFLKVHSSFVSKVLKFPAGRRGLVTNGKVYTDLFFR